jgi:hypothetical protein
MGSLTASDKYDVDTLLVLVNKPDSVPWKQLFGI